MPAANPTVVVSHRQGVGLIALTLLSWASVPLFLRLFREWNLDPFSSNGWRYGISAAFWLPFLILAHRRGRLPPALLIAALVPTLFNVLGQTLFAWVFYLLDPGFGTFIFRIQIVFVTIGAWVLFPAERATLRSARYWLGVAGVVAGSSGLVLFAPGTPQGATAIGIVIALLSGALFAGYGLAVRYCVSQYSPVIGFGVICQYTAVGVVGVMLLLGSLPPSTFGDSLPITIDPALPLHFDLHQWFMLIASAFIGIAISHVMYYAALTRLGVAVSIGIIQLQPVFTSAASTAIGWDRMNTAQWLCGLVGVAGAIVMLWGSTRPAAKPTAASESAAAAHEP